MEDGYIEREIKSTIQFEQKWNEEEEEEKNENGNEIELIFLNSGFWNISIKCLENFNPLD